ncbi:cytochrome c1 [Lichenifustis flavocetrariae]|uniref:Cytochrome c1 n=1 Tax=Lichenifustis flavocetrariae TaxID=2949735 RepID=A0AA41YX09_9HYPH|nr:cytochrome c1 [Lichenifustis flavocetrariae]MCW6506503.1 cytochrome c1 [Lichenifustis flavocetrariae]
MSPLRIFGAPALLAAGFLAVAAPARAQEAAPAPLPPKQSWSFAGPFGRYDQAQLQRGYQVYREVCSNCHSMHFVSFRNLSQAGGPSFSEGQVKALAETFKVQDGPNDAGDMFERPGRPSDPFPSPFPNEQAARAANGGALPPDMSVLAKARDIEFGGLWFMLQPFSQYSEQGVDYIHAVLNGYHDNPPDGFKLPDGKYYNDYYPGHAISMPKPLSDGQVTYTDGSPQTVEQYSHDIAAFLMWAAEPKLVERKRMGLTVVIFLAVFIGLLYAIKKRIWAGIHDDTGVTTAAQPGE